MKLAIVCMIQFDACLHFHNLFRIWNYVIFITKLFNLWSKASLPVSYLDASVKHWDTVSRYFVVIPKLVSVFSYL